MKPIATFWGKVAYGARRGNLLGFPTANIRLHKTITEGIYAAEVRLGKETYQSATFIGSAKTFGEKDYKAESFFLDFNGNLYGKWITIRLYKKLRANKKFTSEDKLKKQMVKDVKNTRDFFTNFV